MLGVKSLVLAVCLYKSNLTCLPSLRLALITLEEHAQTTVNCNAQTTSLEYIRSFMQCGLHMLPRLFNINITIAV